MFRQWRFNWLAPIPYRNNVICIYVMTLQITLLAPIPYRNNVIKGVGEKAAYLKELQFHIGIM